MMSASTSHTKMITGETISAAKPEPIPAEVANAAPKPRDWQAWARERIEYEDPYGHERGRRW